MAKKPRNKKPNQNPRTDIPHHLIFNELFPIFPAKTLVRFKSVCRRWKTDISSLNFANAHFRRFSSTSKSVLALQTHDSTSFESVDYGGLDSELFIKFTNKKFSHPFDHLLASCNGLVLLISSSTECYYCEGSIVQFHLPACVHRRGFRYVVCNPVVGANDFVEVDHPNDVVLCLENDFSFNFGFGHVSSSDDYYIVVVSLPSDPRCPEAVVYVYSLRSKEWKTPRKFKQNVLPVSFRQGWFDRVGTLAKETLYWCITHGEGKGVPSVAAFDLATQDEFRLIELPDIYLKEGDRRYPDFSLCCMDDCLCAYATLYGVVDRVEMWMLENYGDGELWTMLFRFSFSHDLAGDLYCRDFFGFTTTGLVLILTSDYELMLPDFSFRTPQDNDTVVDNLATRLEDVTIVLGDLWTAVNYVQSLVSVRALVSEPGV